MEPFGLYVSVPIACFRVPRAREYFETFPCPPPSTVYGMLLSVIGERNRYVHEGAEIAIALLSEPKYSIVLRTVWRVKDRNEGPGLGNNRRPDFQELLSDTVLAVWVRKGHREQAQRPLVTRLEQAIKKPDSVSRFGGVALGESTHLVDEISMLGNRAIINRPKNEACHLLTVDEEGDLSLPVWPDHVGSDTSWGQYRLTTVNPNDALPENAWTIVRRNSTARM